MKKILITLFTLITFIGSANTDSLTDTDKAAQKALAEQYVQALQNKDLNAVNQLIDYDFFEKRFVSQLSAENKSLRPPSLEKQRRVQEIYSNSINITLLGWKDISGFSGYVIRFIDEKYTTRYVGLIFEKINNKWKIVDFYNVSLKSPVSSLLASSQALTVLDKGSVGNQVIHRYEERDIVKVVILFRRISDKRYLKAIKIYRGLSDEIKKEEVILDLGLIIANNFSDEQFYNELLTVIGKYHQNKPKYYWQLHDYFVMKKEYDKAREIGKNFFIAISDKAMMNLGLANISFIEKDYPRALKEIKQCVKAESTFKVCYDYWISVADTMKNYEEEVAAYNALSKNLGYQFTKSMFNEKEDGNFIHSDAFKNWDIPEK